ncbi:MAG: NADH-quinone oxidoreductase subunit A [Cytophagales bacterium]|nr:MAG: NADH-quinone oxidoreductase subunit A [Cytophagales bacterium]
MLQSAEISAFSIALLFIILGIFFVLMGYLTAWLVSPHQPNEEKQTIYECGEDPIGNAWGQINSKFYIVALLFILFDIEIILLFPWAIIFADKSLYQATQGLWGWITLLEVIVFLFVLALGLVYAWAKGVLEWEKPQPKNSDFQPIVPKKLYEKINEL